MAEGNGKKDDKPKNSELTLRKPHSLEAERGVLGSMLLDNACIPDVMELVRAEEFYAPHHQEVFQALLELYNQHQTVDLTMLVEELQRRKKLDEAGGLLGLASLEQSVLSTGSAPDLARLISQKSTLRRLMTAAEDILQDCATERRDFEDQLDVAEKRIFDISSNTNAASFIPIRDLMEPAIAEIQELHNNKGMLPGLSSGFSDVDFYLNGFHRSDLIILAARPSIGKTAFALNCALNIALKEKVPVAVFSLEMGAQQLNMRLLCSHAKVSSSKVRKGLLKSDEMVRVREAASELQDVPVFIDATPGISLMQLRSRARRLASQYPNLGVIMVDYLQLMTSVPQKGREMNRQQEVAEISRGLKALAADLNLPVIALSQLSRNVEQRSKQDKPARPQLSDLRESGAIEQDADVVMFVHREREELKRDEEGNAPSISTPIPTEIIIGKHRNGPIGTAEILFWPDFTLFSNFDRKAERR